MTRPARRSTASLRGDRLCRQPFGSAVPLRKCSPRSERWRTNVLVSEATCTIPPLRCPRPDLSSRPRRTRSALEPAVVVDGTHDICRSMITYRGLPIATLQSGPGPIPTPDREYPCRSRGLSIAPTALQRRRRRRVILCRAKCRATPVGAAAPRRSVLCVSTPTDALQIGALRTPDLSIRDGTRSTPRPPLFYIQCIPARVNRPCLRDFHSRRVATDVLPRRPPNTLTSCARIGSDAAHLRLFAASTYPGGFGTTDACERRVRNVRWLTPSTASSRCETAALRNARLPLRIDLRTAPFAARDRDRASHDNVGHVSPSTHPVHHTDN